MTKHSTSSPDDCLLNFSRHETGLSEEGPQFHPSAKAQPNEGNNQS
jgi:hypothetical protein